MEVSRKKFIQSAARELLTEFWKRSPHRSPFHSVICDEFLRSLPRRLVREHLRFALVEPMEMSATPTSGEVKTEVAGVLDLRGKQIVVAAKHPIEWRRFTLGHEIGHWVLHRAQARMVFHRDRPLTGGELFFPGRDSTEEEADYFSAHLLMPAKYVERLFFEHFGGVIDTTRDVDHLASLLGLGTGKRVSVSRFAQKGRGYAAFLVAQTHSFGPRTFAPLSARLQVSPSAMSYQLQELGLVV